MILDKLPEKLRNCYDKDSLVYQDDDTLLYNTNVDLDLIKDIKDKNFQIYNGTYKYEPSWKSPKIYLVGRGRTCGKKIFKIEGFLPYCYVDDENGSYLTYNNKPVEKVLFELSPKKVGEFRRKKERALENQPYEADILYVRRFLMDMYDYFKPTEYVEPKVCIMDIETDFPYDNNKIISFAINGYDGHLYYNSKYDTKNYWELILDAYEQLIPYDVLTNWNVDFDFGIIETNLLKMHIILEFAENGLELGKDAFIRKVYKTYRTLKLKDASDMVDALLNKGYLKFNKEDYIVLGDKHLIRDLDLVVSPIDLLSITRKMIAREVPGRWTLDNIGKQTCGVGKVEYEEKYIRDLPPEILQEYNILDVIIPEIIDEVYGGIDCHVILSWSLACVLRDSLITAVVNDIALLRAYHKENRVLNSRPPHGEIDEDSYLAAQPDARAGTYVDICGGDLDSAYPRTVMSLNSSCETKDPNGKFIAPNGVRFNEGNSPFINELKRLVDEKVRIKKELKKLEKNTPEYKKLYYTYFAVKTQVAAFSHGIFGWSSSRMKDKEIADAITSLPREIIELCKTKLDEIGHPWVYSHTDSLYFKAKKDQALDVIKEINKFIEEYCNERGYKHIPYLDFEGYFTKAYIHSPARNVLVDEKGNWKTTGMSFMRSDTPKAISDIERDIIKMKLDECSNEEMLTHLKNSIYNLKKGDTREFGLLKPLNKDISKYQGTTKDGRKKTKPYHIKALEKAYEDYGFDVTVGEKYLILPVIVDEWEGVRKIKRVTQWVAYDIDEGLPEMYDVDWRAYLRSCMFGKVCKLFNLTPRKLEKELGLVYKYEYEKQPEE